jgi:hypothetical protein
MAAILPLEIYQHIGSIFFFFILAGVAIQVAFRQNYFTLPIKTTPPALIDLWDTIQIFTLFISTQFLIVPLILYGIVAKRKEQIMADTELLGWLNLFAILIVAFLLGTFSFIKRKKMKPLFTSNHPAFDFGIGMASWLVAFPSAMFISQILIFILTDLFGFSLVDQTAVMNVKETMKYPMLFATSMFAVTFIVPILEEIIFRGFLQTALTKRLGAFKSILFSSALFAAFHFAANQGINNFNIVGTLFILSLFLGFIRERQGNLLPSIALHTTFNGISILMLLFQVE